MSVMEFYTMENVYDNKTKLFKELKSHMLVTEGVLFNCSARIEKNADGKEITKGNSTEQGLINFLMSMEMKAGEIIKRKEENVLHVIPFNSLRKKASTVVRHPDDPNLVRVFCKGAPEIVIDSCERVYTADGSVVDLHDKKKREILENVVQGFAKKAYRTILIAYTDYTYPEYQRMMEQNNNFEKEKDREVLETDMTLACIFALMDPLRDEIIDSVKKCHAAGINIRMVTGDNLITARAIAL
jgi:magnesium-transporting ATPase (P-type)